MIYYHPQLEHFDSDKHLIALEWHHFFLFSNRQFLDFSVRADSDDFVQFHVFHFHEFLVNREFLLQAFRSGKNWWTGLADLYQVTKKKFLNKTKI